MRKGKRYSDALRILIRGSKNRNLRAHSRSSNSLPRRDGIAVRIGFGRYQRPERVGVRQPRLPDERGNIVGFEGFFENLAPPGEVSAHDGMFGVIVGRALDSGAFHFREAEAVVS